MAQTALAFVHPDEPVYYPESDGEPMGETDKHRKELAETVQTLDRHFRTREDVYVSGNLFLYYEEGNPSACKAPDVFVVTGVAKGERRTYKLWEEGEVPTLVIELTSRSTKREDQEVKPEVYAKLGVAYLFLYDAYEEYLEPPLQAFVLKDGKYRRVPSGVRGDNTVPGHKHGPFPCPPLGLDLYLDQEGVLQFLERETGRIVQRVEVALDKAEVDLAVSEAARVQEKMDRLKAEQDKRREAEARKKEAEARKKEAEARTRAEDALAEAHREIQRLRSLIPGEST